jgi:anti-sigma factor RsiW
MMRAHATAEELQALRRRELEPAAIVELTRHLGGCEACAELARSGVDASAADALRAAATRVTHPDLEEELFPYVNGTLDTEQRRAVAEHLLTCARCR